ncbi:hypothetical protein MXB_5344 [Myxobolus squamalis]|nr:hypothetical protein MXB_5344 [Myxobolus squamalis]
MPVIDISQFLSYTDSSFMLSNYGALFQTPFIDVNMTIGLLSSSSPSVTLSFTIKNKTDRQIIDLTIEKIDDDISSFRCKHLFHSPRTTFAPHSFCCVFIINTHRVRIGDDQIQYNSILPLYPHHFILPVTISPEEFMGRWRGLLK